MIRFVAEVSCDHHPKCEEKASLGVDIEMNSGCSPFGGGPCKAELTPNTYGTGWLELPGGQMRCPKCCEDWSRFDAVSP